MSKNRVTKRYTKLNPVGKFTNYSAKGVEVAHKNAHGTLDVYSAVGLPTNKFNRGLRHGALTLGRLP